METQTDSVLHDDKNVKTNIVELCTREVQTDCSEFFAENNFYLMMQRCIIIQGCQIVNFYCQLLNLS